MKKLMIFPETKICSVLVNYRDMLKNYCVESVCSFKEDFLEESEKCPVSRTYDENIAMKNADAVLLLKEYGMQMEKYQRICDKAGKLGKEIIIESTLLGSLNIDSQSNVRVQEVNEGAQYSQKLKKIPVPVITIWGMGENCDKFQFQLEVKRQLSQYKYKTEYLCSNSMGTFFGMNTLPTFLFDENMGLQKKILKFNQHVFEIYKEHKPEIIVIGVPGGSMALSEKVYNCFSEIPYIISQAVKSDIGIMGLYNNCGRQKENLQELSTRMWFKYDVTIDFFYLSKQGIQYNAETEKIDWIFFDPGNKFEEQHEIFSISDRFRISDCVQSIINMLESNVY